jgi:hypothetical protein
MKLSDPPRTVPTVGGNGKRLPLLPRHLCHFRDGGIRYLNPMKVTCVDVHLIIKHTHACEGRTLLIELQSKHHRAMSAECGFARSTVILRVVYRNPTPGTHRPAIVIPPVLYGFAAVLDTNREHHPAPAPAPDPWARAGVSIVCPDIGALESALPPLADGSDAAGFLVQDCESSLAGCRELLSASMSRVRVRPATPSRPVDDCSA